MILVHVEVERNIKTVAEDRHNRKKGVIVVELDQFRYKISGFEKPMEQIKKSLDLENKKKRKIVLFILKIFIIIINTLFLVFLMLQKYCAAIALALYKKDRN